MGLEKHISESAFLVNESRARNVALSRDRFAHLWVTDSTRRLWDDFAREVYPHDEIELGLRNRFFLERLNFYLSANRNTVFVNVGAGFTSYPFLIDRACTCIEVDYAHVIEFKRQRIVEWTKNGSLPNRSVVFLPTDLNSEADLGALSQALRPRLADAQSFILLEGLTYYLEMDVLQRLFEIFTTLQARDSILAFDFWTPDNAEHPVFIRFKKFCADRFDYHRTSYNLFGFDFVRCISGYSVIELTNVQEQEKIYSTTAVLEDYEQILPEQYAVLMKSA